MIRKLQRGDLDRAAEIWLEANTSAHSFIPRRYWEEQLELVRAALPQAEVFVYQDGNGALQGFIGLSDAHIEGIFVWRPARSQGVGKQLLDCAKSTCGSLTLNVYQKNERAIDFYRREGFRIQGESVDGNTGEREYRMIWERQDC